MRGINEDKARHMLCEAFLNTVYENIPEHIAVLWQNNHAEMEA